jgi:hypothetical protein
MVELRSGSVINSVNTMTETTAQAIARLSAGLTQATQNLTALTQTNQTLSNKVATLEATNATLSTSLLNGPTSVSFHANPYLGDINPSSSIGSKLWKDATSARDPQMNPRVKNANEVMTTLKAYSASFGWGPIVNKISVTMKDGSSKDCNIFRDHKHIKLDDVRISTCPIFYDAAKSEVPPADCDMIMFDITPATDANHKKIFYQRVRAGLIGLKIINSLTTTALSNLEADKKKYTWIDSDGNVFYDGAVILQLIMQHIHPSTRVGLSDLKEKLKNASLNSFNNNVRDMLQHMKSTYDEIIDSGGSHEDYILDLFRALLSAKNDAFLANITLKKGKWDTGEKDIHPDVLSEQSIQHYNNLVSTKQWNTTNAKDAKLVALTTELQALKKHVHSSQSNGGKNSKGGEKEKKTFTIDEWRLKKSHGEQVEKDGKTWHWCHHQHNNGKGMYVTHHPDKHTEWYENRKKSKEAGKSGDSKSGGTAKSLQVNDKLKAAMVAKFKCSDAEATRLISDVGGN